MTLQILNEFPWEGGNMQVLPVVPMDTSSLSPMSTASAGSGGGALTLYSSPIHFTATFYDADTLTLSGHPTITDYSQFVEIEAWSAAGVYIGKYSPRTHVFEWDATNNRVSVTGAAFVTGGTYKVSLLAADRFASLPGNYLKSAEVNPYQLRSDDAGVAMSGTPQNFTGSWADLGAEIPMHGYNIMKIWLTLDKEDGADMRVRVLDKHESGGTEEYNATIEAVGSSVVAFEDHYWEATDDVDQLVTLLYSGDGLTPYVQVQISAGTPGATPAQVDAAYYTRGWR